MSVRLFWRNGLPWAVVVFAIAVALSFVWEMAQSYLYESMGTAWEATKRCLVASVGDGALVLLALTSIRALAGRASIERQRVLAVVFGVVVAIAVEAWGLSEGRWAYLRAMPRVPGTIVGVVPLMQMAILTPVTMWWADRMTGRRA
jgi:hypothetical protein